MKTIGICMSGGGHRVTIFALGALLYLVDAGRHRDIRVLSSVSGGSLTNAFFAVQKKPLHEMNREEFEECAARLAKQIAGERTYWNCTLGGLAVLWTVCLVELVRWKFQPGWWMPQLVVLALIIPWSCLVGLRSGGTFWAWWGTWLYVGLMVLAVIFAFAIWWSPWSWTWCVLCDILVSFSLGWRSWVADKAFRATICKPCSEGGDPKPLATIHATPRHVFCATELHTGEHAFFSHDLIYARDQGLGIPADLPLATAVQVSANFPVAFPFRSLSLKGHDFRLFWWSRGDRLVLTDGGVHDNMATAWFSEIPKRIPAFHRSLKSLSDEEASNPSWENTRARLEGQIGAIEEQPEIRIVINSSIAPLWSAPWTAKIPILGELLALTKLSGVMYNREAITHSAKLRRQFLDKEGSGALVAIEEGPYELSAVIRSDDLEFRHEYFQLDDKHIEKYRALAQRLDDRRRHDWRDDKEYIEAERHIHELNSKIESLKSARIGLNPLSVRAIELQTEINDLHCERPPLWIAQSNRRTKRLRENLQRTTDNWNSKKATSAVATTFRPLGQKATAALLHHAYTLCMTQTALLLEFPCFDDPVTMQDCERLAAGQPRERYPTAGEKEPTNNGNNPTI
jgi:hypothetical protein